MSNKLQSLVHGWWIVPILLPLTGCDPVAITMLGVGANAGVTHHLNGNVFRTFTEPLPRVLQATESALTRMGITVVTTQQYASGDRVRARASDRSIDIDLESLTPATTRMKVVARKDPGFILDAATALEIVVQTDKQLASVDKPPAVADVQISPVANRVAPLEIEFLPGDPTATH